MKENKTGLSLVGIGPSDLENISLKAFRALQSSDIIVGFSDHIELLKKEDELKNKNFISFPENSEIERCQTALELAKNNMVTLVSSCDAGIFGLTTVILELLDKKELDTMIEIIPTMPTNVSASTVVGAPFGGDFCCINGSNSMIPFEEIKRKIEAAIKGNFVISLYNPTDHFGLKKFRELLSLLRKKLGENTAVAHIKNAYRENEETIRETLKDINPNDVDINSILIIGNDKTVFNEKDNVILTKKGYI